MIPKESKDILAGRYGATTDPVNPEIQKLALGDEVPITHRPADDLEPELETLEKEVGAYKEQDEDILSYALFPQVAVEYFKYREAQKSGLDMTKADTDNGAYPV